ncbi:MAG: hypothetical protein AB7N65_16890 [Vicinamibacterales bacterium]
MMLKPVAPTGAALTLPVEVLALALDLESRGFRQSVDARGEYQVEPSAGLTESDRLQVGRWRRHLAVVVAYAASEVIQ